MGDNMKYKIVIFMTISILVGQNGHFAPCDGSHGTQECYGYATVMSFGHPASDTWCPGSTISLGTIPSAFYTITTGQTLSQIKSSVVTGDIVGWSAHGVYVNSNNGTTIMISEKEYAGGPTHDNVNINTVISRLGPDPSQYAKKKSGLYRTLTYQNDFSSGTITVAGTSRASGYYESLLQNRRREITAFSSFDDNGVTQTFTKWSDDNYSTTRTIDADDNKTITAQFNGVPQIVSGFYYDCSVGQDITFRWTGCSNSNVQYKIYRKVKDVQGPTLLATLNNNVTVYTDHDYQRTLSYTDDLLYYDVRAYYIPDANYASEYWHAIYGTMEKIVANNNKITIGIIPNEFSLNNYPNPFNPTTSIQYSLPEISLVKLSIYNLNGNKVREWDLNEQSAGTRKITWDGNDGSGNKVPAGVYIYKLDATAVNSGKYYSEKKKMLFLK